MKGFCHVRGSSHPDDVDVILPLGANSTTPIHAKRDIHQHIEVAPGQRDVRLQYSEMECGRDFVIGPFQSHLRVTVTVLRSCVHGRIYVNSPGPIHLRIDQQTLDAHLGMDIEGFASVTIIESNEIVQC